MYTLLAKYTRTLNNYSYTWFSDEGIAASVPHRQPVQAMLFCSPGVFAVTELGYSMPVGLSTQGQSWTCVLY